MHSQNNKNIFSIRLVILLGLLGISIFLLINKGLVVSNFRTWQYGSARFSLDLQDIQGGLTEAEIKQRFFTLPLHCSNNHISGSKLGDRVCYTELKTYDGLPASFIVFFFHNGGLSSLKIDVPWRIHRKMKHRLFQHYGRPFVNDLLPLHGVRLVGWKLLHGNLIYNLDPHINPLQWNTIYWISAAQTQRIGGDFVKRKDGLGNGTFSHLLRWLLGILVI